MFGQPSTNSPFGTPGTTPGGSSLFGAPSTTPAFGSPAPAPAFGAPAASTTPATGGFGFGSPAPAPTTGFGGFGAATPAPAPTGFGTTFGAPTPAPAFGAAPSSTPFGAPAPAPTGGLFGATPAPSTSGGLFGGGATTSGFGTTTTTPATSAFGAPATSAFGAPAPATSAFGAPAPSAFGGTTTFGGATPAPAPSGGLFGAAPTSTFGAPAPTTSAFGAPAPSGGLFGAATPAPAASSMFGAPAAAAGASGTLQTAYSDTRVNDGSTHINFKSIAGMPQYDKKSFEELRLEDYMAGNKGAQGQNIGGSTFGAPAPAPTGGLFGAAPTTSTFGAPAPSTFGSPTPAPAAFGSPAPSAFGAPAPAPSGGLFGASAPATSTFGAPATSTFGAPAPAPATTGLFGAPAPAPSGGLFGAPAPASSGIFGAPAPAPATSGGLFGAAPTPAPAGGLFGAPAPAPSGGLFGAPASAPSGGLFGAPSPAPSGGLFGAPAPAPSGGLFGASSPAPSSGLFGAPAPAPVTGGLFGAPAPASGGLFGAPTPAPATGGLFGAPAPAPGGLFGARSPAPATGGLFGAPAPAAGGLFGAPAAPGVGSTTAATTVIVPPSADALLAQQLAAVETQKKEMAVLEAWHGSSPGNIKASTSGNVIPTSIFQRDAAAVSYRGLASNGASSRSPLSYPQQIAPKSTAKIRPRGFGPLTPSTGFQISNARSKSTSVTPSAFVGSSTKHLVIKPGSLTPKPKARLLLTDESSGESKKSPEKVDHNGNDEQSPDPTVVIQGRVSESGTSNTPMSHKNATSSSAQKPSPFDVSRIANEQAAFTSPEAASMNKHVANKTPEPSSVNKETTPAANAESYDYYKTVIGSPTFTEEKDNDSSLQSSMLPKLTKNGYVMMPSLQSLSDMSDADLAAVSNFTVEKVGVGSVAWDGAVDVRGIDLDLVISIKHKDVSVYEKQEEMGTKPAEGTKLNRPAVITMHDVFPSEGPQASAQRKIEFDRKIKKSTKNMGAEFIMYDVEKGIWMFRVPHFSRYALVDDSDEEEGNKTPTQTDISCNQDFESGVDGGSTQATNKQMQPGQRSKKRMRLSRTRLLPIDDEDDEALALISHDEDRVNEAAEIAYAKIAQIGAEMSSLEMNENPIQTSHYVDEGETDCHYNTNYPVSILQQASERKTSFSICNQISKRCQMISGTSSSIDYSLRLGRSFRIGWGSNGSYLKPHNFVQKQNQKIVQLKPSLHADNKSIKMLSTHLKHSVRVCNDGETPIFFLPINQKNKSSGEMSTILSTCREICENNSDSDEFDTSTNIVSQAFSLIQTLFVNDISSQSQSFSSWLRDVCSRSVEHEISNANDAGNCYDAIFAALTGGDLSKASSLAFENGLLNLSVIIMNANLQSSVDLSNQMHLWDDSGSSRFVPPHLERIYSFLSQDLGLEESLYENSSPEHGQPLDWKRRLAMLQICMSRNDGDSGLSHLLNQYDADVECGKAPPANAWYISGYPESKMPEDVEKCTLYRIMKIFMNSDTQDNEKSSLSYTISPYGHTSHSHNVTYSFHLAAILSSLEVCCKPLTDAEEFRLLESYTLNLVQNGSWEWAVYAILCSFGDVSISKTNIEWKKRMAIDIIWKHYSDDLASKQRREFLETKIGIPSHWFEVSLSYQSIESLHHQNLTHYVSSDSFSKVLSTFEDVVLPSILFDGDRVSCEDLISYLERVNNELGGELFSISLSGLVFEYLKLSQAVLQFSLNGNSECHELYFHDMLQEAEKIAAAIPKLQQRCSRSCNSQTVPRHIVIAEFESLVTQLVVHLNVLKSGGSILESEKGYGMTEHKAVKIMSKLGYIMSRNNTITLPFSPTMRGKSGIEISI